MAGDHDIDLPAASSSRSSAALVGADLIVLAGSKSGIRTSESMSPASRTPRSARRIAAWPTACAWCSMISPGTGPPSAGSGVTSATSSSGMSDALLRRHRLRPLPGFAGELGAGGGGVARHVAEPGMPEQVVPVGMGGEPGDHRDAEPVHVIGELVQLGAVDAGIDQDQPVLPAHHDGVGPDPLALPDPDAVGHLGQHRFALSAETR